jgi:hypothetical protein
LQVILNVVDPFNDDDPIFRPQGPDVGCERCEAAPGEDEQIKMRLI